LIEKFINENLPNIADADQVEGQFEEFWNIERANALISLAQAENLDLTKLEEVVAQYLFSQKLPLVNEIRPMLTIMPSLKDRNSTFTRIKDKVLEFIETFIEGV
jgi:type I restriction enzyme R subunit